jgi:hypothetical protein
MASHQTNPLEGQRMRRPVFRSSMPTYAGEESKPIRPDGKAKKWQKRGRSREQPSPQPLSLPQGEGLALAKSG